MAEAGGRCNSTREGVFHDLDAALPVYQRQVDADIGQKPPRFIGDEFLDRGEDPADLGRRDMRGGQIMRPALLDLDEDHHVAVAADEVDLADRAAPVPGTDRDAAVFVEPGNRGFGSVTGQMVRQPARLAGLSGRRRNEVERHGLSLAVEGDLVDDLA